MTLNEIFTDKGPRIVESVEEVVREGLKEAQTSHPHIDEDVFRIMHCSACVNSALVPVIEEHGPKLVRLILKEMAERYDVFVKEKRKLN